MARGDLDKAWAEEGGGSRRKARLESFLKREIATCVSTELNDPRLGFITVVRVELDSDFSQVTAYYSLLDGTKRQHLAQQALDRARTYIQKSYAKHVRLKRLPQLVFRYDTADAKKTELDDLIREARASDPNSEPEPPSDSLE